MSGTASEMFLSLSLVCVSGLLRLQVPSCSSREEAPDSDREHRANQSGAHGLGQTQRSLWGGAALHPASFTTILLKKGAFEWPLYFRIDLAVEAAVAMLIEH